ncbi:ATP-binding protein [Aliarcobacter butzleri]|uniref:ATP-binding protein n=1 Tax=Aliarcobacter butzleri TaxID=28197 RepID=UPI0021B206B2|nr:ATP-binding protein [Aliarcobacter butzleri]MCT7582790.1 ATP-binding protein [Aliarcobacter butzleri]
MNNQQILDDSIFKVGEVLSVDGRKVKIKVDKSKNNSHIMYKGELLKNTSVGSYVKIIKGYTRIIGKVEGEFIEEDKIYSSKDYITESSKINRNLIVSMLGFFDGEKFKRGIKELPLVFNECFLLDNQEFEQVHDFIDKDDEPLEIGVLSLEKGQKIQVGVNSLFASHIGIFGNTGSGKSYSLAKLYNVLFEKYQQEQNFKNNARFVLIDFNGEYSHEKTIIENKWIYNLSTKQETNSGSNKIPLKENDLLDIELISILANATDKTQKPFISRTLNFINTIKKNDNPLTHFRNTLKSNIKKVLKMVDKEKAYMLVDYITLIINKENNDSLIETLDWQNTYKYFFKRNVSPTHQVTENEIEETSLYQNVDSYEFPNNVVSKLVDFLYLQIVYDIYNDKAQNEHISPAINKLKSKQKDIEKVFDTSTQQTSLFDSTKNFVTINLNDVNIEMKKTIPMLVVKKLYEEQKEKYKQSNTSYLNIVVDEAHNILSHNSNRESETWKDYRLETFEEIIKEGRKFGVFLTIASQRPSDISSIIISQLHNYFLHRLINNKDIEAVEKTISYLDKVSFEALPILPTGSCIFAGLAAQVPVMVDIGKINEGYKPKSDTIKLTKNWR